MNERIENLSKEYEEKAKIFNYKIEALRPLLSYYRGEKREELSKKISLYRNMADDCLEVSSLLKGTAEKESKE